MGSFLVYFGFSLFVFKLKKVCMYHCFNWDRGKPLIGR